MWIFIDSRIKKEQDDDNARRHRCSWENDKALEVDSEAAAVAGNSSNAQPLSQPDRLMMPNKAGRHLGRKKDLSAEGRAAMAAAKGKSDADAVAVADADTVADVAAAIADADTVAAVAAAVNVSPEKVTAVDKAQLGKDDDAKTPTALSKIGTNVIHDAGSNISLSSKGTNGKAWEPPATSRPSSTRLTTMPNPLLLK